MKLSKLHWKDWHNNAKRALITFKNGYSLSIILGKNFYSNGIDTYEVALIYNNHISYELHDDVWSYVTEKEINKIITQVKNLGTFTNKDVPDSIIIKLLENKIQRLEQEKIDFANNILNKKARQIIQLFVESIDLSPEEKEELIKNPFYVKLLDEFNCLKNKHELVKEANRINLIKLKELRKDNKKLIEQVNELTRVINKMNEYNSIPLRGSE